jgi:hypothetical protein
MRARRRGVGAKIGLALSARAHVTHQFAASCKVFMWGAGGIVMMLMMLVFWGLVIAGLVVGLRWTRPSRRS